MRATKHAGRVFAELAARKMRLDAFVDELNAVLPADERMEYNRIYRLSQGTVCWLRREAEAAAAVLKRPYSELFPPDVAVVERKRQRPKGVAA